MIGVLQILESLQNKQETKKKSLRQFIVLRKKGLATWIIVFYLTQLLFWRNGAQTNTNIINEVIGIALTSAKGQLISKCLFGVFTFFQKTNEN